MVLMFLWKNQEKFRKPLEIGKYEWYTVQELNKACNITVENMTRGELDKCNFLLENTKYSNLLKKFFKKIRN